MTNITETIALEMENEGEFKWAILEELMEKYPIYILETFHNLPLKMLENEQYDLYFKLLSNIKKVSEDNLDTWLNGLLSMKESAHEKYQNSEIMKIKDQLTEKIERLNKVELMAEYPNLNYKLKMMEFREPQSLFLHSILHADISDTVKLHAISQLKKKHVNKLIEYILEFGNSYLDDLHIWHHDEDKVKFSDILNWLKLTINGKIELILESENMIKVTF